MTELRNQPLEIKLSSPLQYAYKGDIAFTKVIKLLPPTAKNRVSLVKIKQLYFKAITDITSKNLNKKQEVDQQKVEDAEITGKAVMMMFYMSDVDVLAVHQAFKELFSHVGMIDEEIKLNNFYIDEISLEDFENAIGEYLNNFLSPSWI